MARIDLSDVFCRSTSLIVPYQTAVVFPPEQAFGLFDWQSIEPCDDGAVEKLVAIAGVRSAKSLGRADAVLLRRSVAG